MQGSKDWSTTDAPQTSESARSHPAGVTSVGGTTLSTDRQGRWLEEQGWIDPPLSQTPAAAYRAAVRPAEISKHSGRIGTPDHRLVPDVSAVADPFTGVRIVFVKPQIGGGTSQSRTDMGRTTTLMNRYIAANGGRPLGDINPLLYGLIKDPAPQDSKNITAGGNGSRRPSAADLVTGLGS